MATAMTSTTRSRRPRRRGARSIVSGVIEISDPLDQGFNVDTVADSIMFDADAANTLFHPTLNCADVDDATDVIHRCTFELSLSSKLCVPRRRWQRRQLRDGGRQPRRHGLPDRPGDGELHVPGRSGSELRRHPAESTTPCCRAIRTTPSPTAASSNTRTRSCATMTKATTPTPPLARSAPVRDQRHGDRQRLVNVDCHAVTVQKTAFTRFDRDFDWNPDKKIVVRPDDVTEQDKATYCTLLNSGPVRGQLPVRRHRAEAAAGRHLRHRLLADRDQGWRHRKRLRGVWRRSPSAGLPMRRNRCSPAIRPTC